MKSVGKARNNGLYRHIRTSKEIIRNLLNDYSNSSALSVCSVETMLARFRPCMPIWAELLQLYFSIMIDCSRKIA